MSLCPSRAFHTRLIFVYRWVARWQDRLSATQSMTNVERKQLLHVYTKYMDCLLHSMSSKQDTQRHLQNSHSLPQICLHIPTTPPNQGIPNACERPSSCPPLATGILGHSSPKLQYLFQVSAAVVNSRKEQRRGIIAERSACWAWHLCTTLKAVCTLVTTRLKVSFELCSMKSRLS